MTAAQLRAVFEDHDDDYCFYYEDKQGSVCIFSDAFIGLSYGGETLQVKTLDEVMTTPFINGKSLSDLAEEIILTG